MKAWEKVCIRLEINLRNYLNDKAAALGQYTPWLVRKVVSEELEKYRLDKEGYQVDPRRKKYAPAKGASVKTTSPQMSVYLTPFDHETLMELCDRVGETPRLIIPGLLLNNSVCDGLL